jgi:succinate dehydrogenase/fumarate reductase flavoprotein subunit
MVEEIRADVLVAGGGMGGIMAAERARLAGARVVLLTALPGASTRMAGFATAIGEGAGDRPQDLFDDMFVAGGFVNSAPMLAALTNRIGRETRFFEELGIPYVRQSDEPGAPLARRQASGVTRPRAAYSREMVGDQAMKALLERLRSAGSPQVRVLDNGFLFDVEVADGRVCGGLARLRSDKAWIHVAAPAVVLATGGCGRLYRKTTNFLGSTGMGYAMALEAGAQLVDMEFVSFEPSVAIGPERVANMELPTMAFSDGARLLNSEGESFVSTQPPASKDVMSRAIMREVAEGRGSPAGGVYYDMKEMDPEVAASYQQIRRILRALDLPPGEAEIEVGPFQHYMMGGIRTDETAASRVPGLFAVGEVAGGAHGAHRLATCGGSEVIAMGAIAGEAAAHHALLHQDLPAVPEPAAAPELLDTDLGDGDRAILEEIRDALEEGCWVLRDHRRLEAARLAITAIRDRLADQGRAKTFIGRSALVAAAIAESAARREESRGDHYRTDFPDRDDRSWFGNLVADLGPSGSLTVSFEPITARPA